MGGERGSKLSNGLRWGFTSWATYLQKLTLCAKWPDGQTLQILSMVGRAGYPETCVLVHGSCFLNLRKRACVLTHTNTYK